ncbi:hypothetical protein EVAR_41482_1 [Eumeta japonica]|uniref:Uncharacterized protein n=1 Tax=Eumeta variegata TaxID=151549 RepID=A0A4C1WZ82_EUMVA|nr:hypothetical protein EVAR_41482_1 [Eumeta japonica]
MIARPPLTCRFDKRTHAKSRPTIRHAWKQTTGKTLLITGVVASVPMRRFRAEDCVASCFVIVRDKNVPTHLDTHTA